MTIFLQILSWLKNHYKPVIAIILLVTTFFFGWFESKSHWQTPLLTEISKYKDERDKANAKIDQISNQAKQDTKDLTATIEKANSTIDDLQSKYATERNRKQKIVYVTDPRDSNKKLPIEFNRNGDMICRRFSDTYLETLNAMVKEANK